MNEFLLLALVIIYLVISYVPISGAPKPTWQGQHNEPSSQANPETDATAITVPIPVHDVEYFFAYPERYGRAIFDTRNDSGTVKVR